MMRTGKESIMKKCNRAPKYENTAFCIPGSLKGLGSKDLKKFYRNKPNAKENSNKKYPQQMNQQNKKIKTKNKKQLSYHLYPLGNTFF